MNVGELSAILHDPQTRLHSQMPVRIEGRRLKAIDVNFPQGTVELIPDSKIKVEVVMTATRVVDFDLGEHGCSINDALSIVQCQMLAHGLQAFAIDPKTKYDIEVNQVKE